MYLSLLLHLHQPPTQYPEVLKNIVEGSYRKIFYLLKKYPKAKVTVNITASLVEQLVQQGFTDVVTDISLLSKRGQIELTGTAAYHALLTELPEEEVKRQVTLNWEMNKCLRLPESENSSRDSGSLLGGFHPTGFFPPELAVDDRVVSLVSDLGYRWMVVEEGALELKNQKSKVKNESFNSKIYSQKVGPWTDPDSKRSDLKEIVLIPRNKPLSVDIAFSRIRHLSELQSAVYHLPSAISHKPPTLIALDGETFGHHRPEQLNLLEELLRESGKSLDLITVSELIQKRIRPPKADGPSGDGQTVTDRIRDHPWEYIRGEKSTWGESFLIWRNPKNPVHRWQWQLTHLAIEAVNNSKHKIAKIKDQSAKPSSNIKNEETCNLKALNLSLRSDLCSLSSLQEQSLSVDQKQWLAARQLLDKALHSDQYFWASHRPYWHPGMVERGASFLRESILAVPDLTVDKKASARKLYREIIKTGIELFGRAIIPI